MIREFLARAWEMLIGRVHGPFTFRLILQPLAAVIFAIRAELRGAREGRTAYFWSALVNPEARSGLLRERRKDVGKVFIVAFALDLIYELIVYRWVYFGQALIVAIALAIIPYLLICGPVTRIARFRCS